MAFLQSGGNTGTALSTMMTGLTPGVVYEVSFRANSRAATAIPGASWSLNGGARIPFTVSPAVGVGKPYYTIIGSFTATSTTAPLVIWNQSVADSALLVDDFRIVARQVPGSGWTIHRWAGDASSSLSPAHTLWAYQFGSTGLAGVNGLTVIGLPGGEPSVAGRFSLTGPAITFGNHANSLTALGGIGSAEMARNFIYAGHPATLTVRGLTAGIGYRVSLFGVAFESPGGRVQTFASGGDARVLDEDAFDAGGGVRVDYAFTASNATQVITVTPRDGASFHFHGLALSVTSTLRLSGPALLTNECHTAYSEWGAFNSPLSVAGGQRHSLALRADGSIVGWGSGAIGQTNPPVGMGRVTAVAAGGYHSLGLKENGTVAAWGSNSDGQTNVPPGLNNVVAIDAGLYHNLALKSDGSVIGWGRNFGNLSVIPAAATNVVAIAAGGYHSLALRKDGTLVGWGLMSFIPTNLASGVVAISAGAYHNVALRRDGTVVTWGGGTNGSPTPANLGWVNAIVAGDYNVTVLKSDSSVISWGQYETSLGGPLAPFVAPAGLSNVVAVAGRGGHGLAIKDDGRIVSWGNANFGQTNVPSSAYLTAVRTGAVDTNTPGDYTLTYTSANGIDAGVVTRKVLVRDTRPPVVTLVGANPLISWRHLPLQDPGVTAMDACSASLHFSTNSTVNTAVPGTYTIAYVATDPSGSSATNTRTVLIHGAPEVLSMASAPYSVDPVSGLMQVRLEATVAPNGLVSTVEFHYGITTNYGGKSAVVALPASFRGSNVTFDVGMGAGFTHHWRVAVSNSGGSVISPDRTVDLGTLQGVPGDLDGDGVVTGAELDAVYANYLPTSPWLAMTNVAGLGGTNVTFALEGSPLGAYTVEFSTNLTDWQPLGSATPRYGFTDTNAPAQPLRYYRLRHP